MAETAAHLVEHVLPEQPIRQWVLSLQQFPLAGLVVACGGLEPLGWECSDRSGERSPRSVALC